jgi:hypothetical protein
VDFDELEEDTNWDCSTPCRADSLEDFCTAVKADLKRYPDLKRLVRQLKK